MGKQSEGNSAESGGSFKLLQDLESGSSGISELTDDCVHDND